MNECLTTPQHKITDRLLGVRKRSSKEEFWNFFDILNQQDDNIKVKATISDQSVNCLDVTICIGTHFETSG